MRSALIVDDNEINREVVESFLEIEGFNIQSCESALEALKKLDGERFDFLFLDIHMPELNGQDFLRLAREELQAGGTEIIVLTGDETVKSENLPAYDKAITVLHKPINLDDIERIISSKSSGS